MWFECKKNPNDIMLLLVVRESIHSHELKTHNKIVLHLGRRLFGDAYIHYRRLCVRNHTLTIAVAATPIFDKHIEVWNEAQYYGQWRNKHTQFLAVTNLWYSNGTNCNNMRKREKNVYKVFFLPAKPQHDCIESHSQRDLH